MRDAISDFVPAYPARAETAAAAPPSRRGGRRPGAGARPGNLNAFKHGRYSRFRDAIPPSEPVTAGAARRLVSREQRIAERHAANLLVLARFARYQVDCAAVVEEGRPLPPPPLLGLQDLDVKSLQRLLGEITAHTMLERPRAAGTITSEHEGLRRQLAFARTIERILPVAVESLDRSAAAALAPAALTALLGPVTQNEPGDDQPLALPAESTAHERSTVADSASGPREKTSSIKESPEGRRPRRSRQRPEDTPA